MGVIWEALALANVIDSDPYSDIMKEVGSMATLFQVPPVSLGAMVQANYAATKNELSEMIDSHLPDIYATSPYGALSYSQWWQSFGFTYNQTDEIRERIRPLQIDGVDGNWTVDQILAAIGEGKKITIQTMTTTFAALFIKRAFMRTGTAWKASTNSGMNPFSDQVLLWKDESARRWKECQKRLWIDFYGTGQVTDGERARIKRRTLSRG